MLNLVTSLWPYRIGVIYFIKFRPRDSELINNYLGFNPKVRLTGARCEIQLAN
jgi:hypothetical protein